MPNAGTVGDVTNTIMDNLIEAARFFVENEQGADSTGHDHWHSFRVGRLARRIAEGEGCDPHLAELAGVLHDVRDEKFSGDPSAGPAAVAEFLFAAGADQDVVTQVVQVVQDVSFKGARVTDAVTSKLCEVVRDADRLEAIGAIGIARTFAYGGYVGRPLHDPAIPPVLPDSKEEYRMHVGTTLNHFEEKLLLLKDRLVTKTARELAVERHAYMDEFKRRFHQEWSGA